MIFVENIMNGRENFKRAVEFKEPEYLPCTIGVDLDWLYDKDEGKREQVRTLSARYPDDLIGWVSPADFGDELGTRDGVRRQKDQWGTGWENDGHGAKTVSYPLEDGYEALTSYPFPDPHHAGRFDAADERLQQRRGRYVQATVWFTLFERLWMLRGFENMLMDPYMDEGSFGRSSGAARDRPERTQPGTAPGDGRAVARP
jgi:uroporphyrinogen decarboxylase